MTKTDLQKELLEKVKPGTKPSDLKKQKLVKPKTQKDEGYSSDEEKIAPTKKEKELQKEVNYWSQTASNHLKNLQLTQARVSNLEEQLRKKPKNITPLTIVPVKSESELLEEKNKQIEIIAKENERNLEKVRKLEKELENTKKRLKESFEERSLMNKTIEELKKQGKIKEKVKEMFTCYHCKNQQELSLLVLELPEGKLCQPCWTILRKKTKQNLKEVSTPKPQLFTCVVCEEEKKEIPIYKKVDISYKTHLIKGKEYPVCSACSTQVKEYNENEGRDLEEWE